jgi:hypothetical protein
MDFHGIAGFPEASGNEDNEWEHIAIGPSYDHGGPNQIKRCTVCGTDARSLPSTSFIGHRTRENCLGHKELGKLSQFP